MKNKRVFLVGLISGGWLAFCLVALSKIGGCGADRPPTIAGQAVPEQRYQVDFSKRYDLIVDSYRSERVIENCLIKGLTEKADSDSSGGLSRISKYRCFDEWLVVELLDKRLAYLPQRSVRIIEETSPSNNRLDPKAARAAKGQP